MQDKLNEMARELLEYWLRNNIRQDFKFFELFVKVSLLSYSITNITDIDIQDIEISKLMTYIERQFKLSLISSRIFQWLNENNGNKFILNIYERLSIMRTL